MKIFILLNSILIIIFAVSCSNQITETPPITQSSEVIGTTNAITPNPPYTNQIIEWNPKLKVEFDTSTIATVNGKNFVISEGGNEYPNIYIIDVTNPINPVIISKLTHSVQYINFLKSYGTTFYTISIKGLGIFDISDPYHPIIRKNMPIITGVNIEISGQYAYIVDSNLPDFLVKNIHHRKMR